MTTAKYGVISLHHGDNRFYRGRPPGFWEVLHRNPRTGFIIQILNEELDNGLVLQRGWQLTRRTYTLNYHNIKILKFLSQAYALETCRETND